MIRKNDGFDLHFKWNSPEPRKYAFSFISLFLFLIIIYGNSFRCEWHFDDFPNIVGNQNVHLKTLTTENITKTFYGRKIKQKEINRPLSYLTFALNYYLDGTNVLGYHIINFIIHYLTSLFLFMLVYETLKLPRLYPRYGGSAYAIALLAAVFWATHPIQTLAVTYIVQRMTSMATLFYMMAMYFYLKGRMAGRIKKRVSFFSLCAVSGILSLMSKEIAAMLPVSLFLFDLFLIQGLTRTNIRKNLIIAVVPAILFLVIGTSFKDLSSILDGYSTRSFTLTERLLTEPRIILFYITLILYPIDSRLALIHDIEISTSLFHPVSTLLSILLIINILVIAIAIARKQPLISFGIIFFFLNHLIEGSFIPLELIYEHRNYLPSTFLFVPGAIFMVYILDYFSYKKSLQFMMALGILFLLITQGHTCFERNRILKIDFDMWFDNALKAPRLSRVYNNMGTQLFNVGLYEEAGENLKKAIALNRDVNLLKLGIFQYNMGLYCELMQKESDRALAYYKKALELNPSYPQAIARMLMIKLSRGEETQPNMDEIINHAISRSPYTQRAMLFDNYALVLLKQGRLKDSLRAVKKALEINPNLPASLQIIPEVFRREGNTIKSIQHWEAFLEKRPDNINGIFALIELYSKTENWDFLEKTINRLICKKGDKDFQEMIDQSREDSNLKVYVPETEKIMPIIKDYYINQAKLYGER